MFFCRLALKKWPDTSDFNSVRVYWTHLAVLIHHKTVRKMQIIVIQVYSEHTHTHTSIHQHHYTDIFTGSSKCPYFLREDRHLVFLECKKCEMSHWLLSSNLPVLNLLWVTNMWRDLALWGGGMIIWIQNSQCFFKDTKQSVEKVSTQQNGMRFFAQL